MRNVYKFLLLLLSHYIIIMVGFTAGGLVMSMPNEAERIMLDVHNSNDYDNETYNCRNYTMDAVDILRDAGYEAYSVAGFNSSDENGTGHAWVKVCRDYDVTAGLGPPDVDRWDEQLILNHTNSHRGVMCPWMDNMAWCNWYEDRCGDGKQSLLRRELRIRELELQICETRAAMNNLVLKNCKVTCGNTTFGG
jgi:hypothetical protein